MAEDQISMGEVVRTLRRIEDKVDKSLLTVEVFSAYKEGQARENAAMQKDIAGLAANQSKVAWLVISSVIVALLATVVGVVNIQN